MKKLVVLCLFSICFVSMVNAQQKTAKAHQPATQSGAAKPITIKHSVSDKRTHRSSMANKKSSMATADIYMKPVEPAKMESNPYQLKYGEKVAAIDREIEKMKVEINNQKISADEKTKKLKECETMRKKMMIDMMGEESYIEYKNAGN